MLRLRLADYKPETEKLTIYLTTQAPHIIRTAVAIVAELPEHKIRIISPDLGGGFGNKVPVYPGYVCATLASVVIGRPVKWIEDKTGNLISTGYARDMYCHGELALTKEGKILGARYHADTDNGGFFSDAQPTKFKIGLYHSVTGAYKIPVGYLTARGHYTNKAPGGVAYRCSFRITEALFFQERFIQNAAYDMGMDPTEFRRLNFVQPDEFPYRTCFGFLMDSGDYEAALDIAMEQIGYARFQAGEGSRPHSPAACSASAPPASPSRSAPATPVSTTSSASRCSTPPSCGFTPPVRQF